MLFVRGNNDFDENYHVSMVTVNKGERRRFVVTGAYFRIGVDMGLGINYP